MIDRGFVKWQPFNSLTPSKETIKKIKQEKKDKRPILFPEETIKLSNTLIDVYYTKEKINITYYENGKIKNIISIIKKIHPSSNTIELECNKIIFFNQIIHIVSSE